MMRDRSTPGPVRLLKLLRILAPVGAIFVLSCQGDPETETAGLGASSGAMEDQTPGQPVRLVDIFDSAEVNSANAEAAAAPPRTEWVFANPPTAADDEDDAAATGGWSEGGGVEGLAVEEGALVGTSSSDHPLIHASRTEGLDENDRLHAVEIRMKASAGANVAFTFQKSSKANPGGARGVFARYLTSPLVPGDEMRTYTIRNTQARKSSDIKQILIRPTDAEGARFEIESVRLIFLKEHLAEIPAGAGWHGLDEIYHEAIAARVPETTRFTLTLPPRPWLDVSIGTIESDPVNFRIDLAVGDGKPVAILDRTVTTKDVWDSARIDLAEHAGKKVTLSLSLSAERAGTIGFWGSPVIRSRAPETSVAAVDAPPRNVILIMCDTLRSDHLDAYGYGRETAPNLRRMAEQGVIVKDAISQATWTKVSTPSLMTSLYPTAHTVAQMADRLPSSANTLAEAYRQAGHATLSFSSVAFTGQFTNLHQGFEQLHESTSLKTTKSSKTAREYVDRLMPWLEDHKDVPFFVYLHVFDPHDPYEHFEPFASRWTDAESRERHTKEMQKVRPKIKAQILRMFGMPTREEIVEAEVDPEAFVEHFKNEYDGAIRAMDTEVGRLLERLGELGLAENTQIVFVSDHGEEFLDHGRSFHGHSVYGELTNVPLIFYRPGAIPTGGVIESTARVIDIMPTLLEMSGLPLPEGIQGQSLVPLIAASASPADSSWSPPPAITEKAADAPGPMPVNGEWETYSIILDGWKLVHHFTHAEDMAEFELYNHKEDPTDQNDVAAENDEIVKRLAAELRSWKDRTLEAKLTSDAETLSSASAEDLKRLRSLGYLQ